MKNTLKGKIVMMVLFGIAVFLFVAWIVMLLWNALLPEIIGVKAVSYWQAAGILVLSKILFGGFGGRKCKGRNHLQDLKEKHIGGMSPDEKEKLREMWKARCGHGFFGNK